MLYFGSNYYINKNKQSEDGWGNEWDDWDDDDELVHMRVNRNMYGEEAMQILQRTPDRSGSRTVWVFLENKGKQRGRGVQTVVKQKPKNTIGVGLSEVVNVPTTGRITENLYRGSQPSSGDKSSQSIPKTVLALRGSDGFSKDLWIRAGVSARSSGARS